MNDFLVTVLLKLTTDGHRASCGLCDGRTSC